MEVDGEYAWGFGPPKTKKGRRTIDLDPVTVGMPSSRIGAGSAVSWETWTGAARALRAQKAMLAGHRLAFGPAYEDSDLVFARADGRYLDPDVVSETFDKLASKARVSSIRLHDLRHTHATLLLKAHVPVKVVSERLGHAKVTITMERYQHVIPGMQQEAAATFAAVVGGNL